MITTPDFYPTLLSIAGETTDRHQAIDGTDFSPALCGRQLEDRPVYWHYPHYPNQGATPAAAVRQGRWKLIRFFTDDHLELYDLETDVAEEHDLRADQPVIVEAMARRLERWLLDVNAQIPVPNPHQPFTDLPG